MSTLGRMLRLDVSDREHFYPRKPLKIEEAFSPDVDATLERVTRYQLRVTYGTTATIKDTDYRGQGAVTATVERARQHILDGVYGEYMKPLFEAVRHIDNYEADEARDILLKVLENMRNSDPMEEK